MASEMSFNNNVCFGFGCRDNLISIIKKNNYKRALLVTDDNLISLGITDKVTKLLDDNNINYDVYSEVKSNPNVATVKRGLKALRKNHSDYIIAVGGGSVIDTAKAMSVVINNTEYKDLNNFKGRIECKDVMPVIAIPTTCGTGSEGSSIIVLNDDVMKERNVTITGCGVPSYAIVDTELMSTMPVSLAVATGLDAFTQAIESYLNDNESIMSDTLSLRAIELIYGNLEKSLNKNKEAMEKMVIAQYMAGLGASNKGLGIARAIAYQICSCYGGSEGIVSMIVLPSIIEYNKHKNMDKYREILKVFGHKVSNLDDSEVLIELTDIIKNMAGRLDVSNMDEIKDDDILELATKVMSSTWISESVKVEDIEKIIREAF